MLASIILTLALLFSTNSNVITNDTIDMNRTYMRAMVVIELDYTNDIVVCKDSVGFVWEFYGCEDYCEGDLVCTLMNDMNTIDTIEDDEIIMANYSGYWME